MRRFLAGLVAFGVLGLAAVFAASDSWPWRRFEVVAPAPEAPAVPRTWVASDTLHAGETLGELFGRHGIAAFELDHVIGLLGIDARRIRAGQVFRFGHRDSVEGTTDVTVRVRPDLEARAIRGENRWTAEERAIRWDRHPVRIAGRIESSLYDAMIAASWSEDVDPDDRIRLAWDLADVFAWGVDFTRDIQPADQFVIVFEREVSELGETRIGAILASRLEVAGKPMAAFRFETPDGRSQYFDEDGTSLRRAFLRAPVEFRRIASGFSRSRKHPILGIFRRHQGIDYSASSGTPVLAAGDGTVLSAGWAGGYGRMVELRHRNGITTRYAHLRAFAKGVRAGSRVSQGEVIGFVGATGLASGAHLHYEFRQNGVARDPNRVELGSGDPVPTDLREPFRIERDRLRALLDPPAAVPAPPSQVSADGSVAGDR